MVARRSFSTAAVPTTLSADITNAAVTLSVVDGSTYVDATLGPSVLTLNRGKSNEERILYTSRVGNTFSGLTRGYNGTAAQAHTAGEPVEHTSTQQDFDEANAHIADATRNDHTQYARVGATNTFTATQTFNAAVAGSGSMGMTNPDHYFGANALGGAGTRIHLGSLGSSTAAFVEAEGSGANVALILNSKGTGSVNLQHGGTDLFILDPSAGVAQMYLQPNYLAPSNTSASATAGAAGAPPAQVFGYLNVKINGSDYRIPFYTP